MVDDGIVLVIIKAEGAVVRVASGVPVFACHREERTPCAEVAPGCAIPHHLPPVRVARVTRIELRRALLHHRRDSRDEEAVCVVLLRARLEKSARRAPCDADRNWRAWGYGPGGRVIQCRAGKRKTVVVVVDSIPRRVDSIHGHLRGRRRIQVQTRRVKPVTSIIR